MSDQRKILFCIFISKEKNSHKNMALLRYIIYNNDGS